MIYGQVWSLNPLPVSDKCQEVLGELLSFAGMALGNALEASMKDVGQLLSGEFFDGFKWVP